MAENNVPKYDPRDNQANQDANVRNGESANGVDAGTVSGVAIGGLGAAVLAVIAVVRHRRAQAIRLEEQRKTDSELAMRSRRSAIMML